MLTFVDEPQGIDDSAPIAISRMARFWCATARSLKSANYAAIARMAGRSVEIADHRPHLVLPGLIDTHLHFPQTQAIASYGAQLLEWLNTYIFVEEQKFSSRRPMRISSPGGSWTNCFRTARRRRLPIARFTRKVSTPISPRPKQRGMLMIGGKVMMDRNAPDALRDTPQSGYDETKALIGKWHGRGRAHYAISPRFAITSTPEQMEMSRRAGARTSGLLRADASLRKQGRDRLCHIALSASRRTIPTSMPAMTCSGQDAARALHLLHDREISVLAETGAVGVFCPTSNLFLGSGLFDRDRFDRLGARMVGCDRCRRRDQLLDAGDNGRGL